ncbi:hypothetical protein C8A05DRAFT_39028 [Staphylotrichum tortipilum]|uniref:Secreted protein n=1 Tax=Staphylotrichum tortipilum TaxID=2831512 RepID=A0AAN6RN94_9PEZI|nr:hypothetical protein C8A05DRAFT_39028 [Staphylotrichum longicolle]
MRASLASFLVAFVAKTAMAVEAPIPGYVVETLEWDVPVAPGQVEVLNGTIQEVFAQALQINPDFKLQQDTGASTAAKRGGLEQHEKRTTVLCGNWPLANKGRIEEGIRYLRVVPAAPRNGPGPGACGRVSCSYNSAIWWCNDNTTPKTLESWDWIANSAGFIIQNCAPAVPMVSGQNFESGNWNTIVRGDSC